MYSNFKLKNVKIFYKLKCSIYYYAIIKIDNRVRYTSNHIPTWITHS